MNDVLQKKETVFLETILVVDEALRIVKMVADNEENKISVDLTGYRVDQIPGLLYPEKLKEDIRKTVIDCIERGQDKSVKFFIYKENGFLLSLKACIVSIQRKLVVTLHDQTKLLELQKENLTLISKYAKQSNLIELALRKSDVAVYSFSFERFNACDRKHCQRCFQFCGTNNELLERNKYLCRALTILRHPEDREDFFLLFNTIRSGKVEEAKMSFRLKDNEGAYRLYEVFGKVQEYDSNGVANLIIGTVTDNQGHMEYEQTLIHAKEKAETADRLKSAFLANMTHEIRTPLHAIVGFSDLLKEETDSHMREEYINVIKANNEMLMRLINDVLDISKIEANMMTFNYIPLNVPIWMNDIYKVMKMRISNKVELIMDPCPNVNMDADKQRLTQVLNNLLTNAIKYTEKGSIRLGYTVDESYIHFYVADTGIGIAKEMQENIFSRFEQLKAGKQGVGLGLAICKGLVAHMGGRMTVTSEEGVGSTFNFSLPLRQII